MVHDKKTILKQIKETVLKADPSAEVILFGSRARGDYERESDWDILILIDRKNDTSDFKSSLRNAIYKIELQHSIVISGLIYTKTWWREMGKTPFFNEVKNEGIAI